MRYLSVCSGIEAATCAWHPLGWEPVAFSEIERFPGAVLAHHYPNVPNLGDMAKFQEWPDDFAPNLLVGGTPCQSFSVAGLRKGLADPRGNLALVYLAMADRYRPEWLVWENVPGVLSSNGGRDFGAFLGALVQLGYGFAYRVLDAQYFGVAQRRRRVFVVANARDWRRAAAVLFERHSLSGHPAPRREAGEAAPTIPSRSSAGGGLGTDFDCDGGLVRAWPQEVSPTLTADYGDKMGLNNQRIYNQHGGCFVPAVFDPNQVTSKTNRSVPTPGLCHTLPATSAPPIALGWQNSAAQGDDVRTECAPTLDKSKTPAVHAAMAVRRLTPRECERLQGFPDDYTAIPRRGKPADQCPDGPRYKALGNSMAVPVMAWIGRRIAAVAAQLEQEAA